MSLLVVAEIIWTLESLYKLDKPGLRHEASFPWTRASRLNWGAVARGVRASTINKRRGVMRNIGSKWLRGLGVLVLVVGVLLAG